MMESAKPPQGQFTLLYFASAASFTKKDADFFEAPCSVFSLYQILESKYAGIYNKVLVSCALTINLNYIDVDNSEDFIIREGDEVAIIPPVSSG